MIIHIYLNGFNIDKTKMTYGIEDVLNQISEKREEIYTTEIHVIEKASDFGYDIEFHYNNDTVLLSKAEIIEPYYSNIIDKLMEFVTDKKCENIAFVIFNHAKDAKTEFFQILEDIEKENDEISKIQNLFQYIRFRGKQIWENHLYLLCFYIISIIRTFFGNNNSERVLLGMSFILIFGFFEFAEYSINMKNGGKKLWITIF